MPDGSHADSLAGAVHRLGDVVPKGDRSSVAIERSIADRLSDGLSRYLESDVLVNLRPPRLVLVGEPDLLRVEGADQPLAFGARLVELGKEDRHVAADDD